MPFHNRTARWSCLVAHRRAGKTVAAVNEIIVKALTCRDPMARFAYIAPFRSQAKSVAWEYLKHFAQPVTKSTNEGELYAELVNGPRISLYGADNADAMRGLGFNGVYLDEFGDFKPSVYGNVIRPTLSDRQGWAVFGGTPKGKNQFHDIYKASQREADWFCLRLPASQSGLLPSSELKAAREQLSQDQYDQEYECSFDAAILGAFYGREMREAEEAGRITNVHLSDGSPVYTAWDLGYKDDTAIWWYQVVYGEVHVLGYYAVSGSDIRDLAGVVIDKATEKGYEYGRHWLPHDARAKTLASGGKSIIEQLGAHLGMSKLAIVPDLSVQDGIQAVRQMLPRTWFDVGCDEGLEALRQYQREYDEDKKAFRQTPRHDWCFTGDTEILTRYGTCQIMNLPYSGEVLTSCGWKRYVNPRITRRNAPLVEVQFTSGYSVRCTPDHLFKTANGWKSAESLTRGLQIQSSWTPLRSISMAACIAYGRVTNIFHAAARSCIEMCGELHSAIFQTDAIYTTGTQTQKIMRSQTWSASPPKSTYPKLGQRTKKGKSIFLMLRGMLPLNGTSLMKGACGTGDTQSDRNRGQNGSAKKSPVFNAASYLWHSFASQEIVKSIAAKSARLLHTERGARTLLRLPVIESVKKLSNTQDVWCLTAPNAEEFSLSNGAVVHNCSHPADAMRMLAIAWRHEAKDAPVPKGKTLQTATIDELWEYNETHKDEARI